MRTSLVLPCLCELDLVPKFANFVISFLQTVVLWILRCARPFLQSDSISKSMYDSATFTDSFDLSNKGGSCSLNSCLLFVIATL